MCGSVTEQRGSGASVAQAQAEVATTIARDLGDAVGMAGSAASRDGRTFLYGRRDSSVDDLMLVEHVR